MLRRHYDTIMTLFPAVPIHWVTDSQALLKALAIVERDQEEQIIIYKISNPFDASRYVEAHRKLLAMKVKRLWRPRAQQLADELTRL